jgi:hypothetical protein
MKFPRMRGEAGRLERELRASRPEPRAELLVSLSEKASAQPRRASSRLAFGLAVMTFVLGSFASFGGIGYAASGANSAVKAVKHVVAHHPRSLQASSAADEYVPTGPPASDTAGQSAVAGAAAGVQSTLPFTGISLFVTCVVGFALLGAGLILRRAERLPHKK